MPLNNFRTVSETGYLHVFVYVFKPNGNDFLVVTTLRGQRDGVTWRKKHKTLAVIERKWKEFTTHLADISGDGKADLVMVKNRKNDEYELEIISFLSNGDGTFGLHTVNNYGKNEWKHFSSHVADINGDCLMDMMLVKSSQDDVTHMHIVTFKSSGNGEFGSSVHSRFPDDQADWKEDYTPLTPDINGDGCTDLLMVRNRIGGKSYLKTWVWESNGNGGYENSITWYGYPYIFI
jgi:hypothetical protein